MRQTRCMLAMLLPAERLLLSRTDTGEHAGGKHARLSAEEDALWKEATREYNALKMHQHRAWQTELSIKLQLKKAALAPCQVCILVWGKLNDC